MKTFLRFSLPSLLWLLLCVALALALIRQSWMHRADVMRLHKLKTLYGNARRSLDKEFTIQFPDAVLAVELRNVAIVPPPAQLYDLESDFDHTFGSIVNTWTYDGSNDIDSQDTSGVSGSCSTRFIRALKGVDYWRLRFSPTTRVNGNHPRVIPVPDERCILFGFDGEAKVLVDEEEIAFVVASSAKEAQELLLSVSRLEERQ